MQTRAHIERSKSGGRLVVLALFFSCGCDPPASTTASPTANVDATAAPAGATGSAAAPAAGVDPTEVAAVVNPRGQKPYNGKTGSLTGRVTATGDPPPTVPVELSAECSSAVATYGRLFRVGQDNALADVLVGVTGYDGFVPAPSDAVAVTIRECAFSTRTVAMTFGQRLEVQNLDGRLSYVPQLEGARSPSVSVAVPKGEPIKLYARKPGRLSLRDQMRPNYPQADVFVLKYATFDVTELDGRYRIDGIPVGEVEVGAVLPSAGMLAAERKRITIAEGDNQLDLSIRFDASMVRPAGSAEPAPSASAP